MSKQPLLKSFSSIFSPLLFRVACHLFCFGFIYYLFLHVLCFYLFLSSTLVAMVFFMSYINKVDGVELIKYVKNPPKPDKTSLKCPDDVAIKSDKLTLAKCFPPSNNWRGRPKTTRHTTQKVLALRTMFAKDETKRRRMVQTHTSVLIVRDWTIFLVTV